MPDSDVMAGEVVPLTTDCDSSSREGPWEAEYSYGKEADLHRHFDNCMKNPGHKNFIPVDKFSIQDLPEDYRDTDVVDYIRAVSDLTVRVTVKYVSDRRPATVPGIDRPYPGHCYRGQRRTTVGTGWVDSVRMYDDSLHKACQCKDCLKSSKPRTRFAEIHIITSLHMVFDDSEGEHTTCHLYFDSRYSPETCAGVVALTGMSNVNFNLLNDWCDMNHFTHDMELAHKLHQRCKQMSVLRDAIFMKTPSIDEIKHRHSASDKQPLLFVVSHPHGCSKQISLGHWTGMRADTHKVSFMYTTPTCPGSSGAHVYMLQDFTSPHGDVTSLTFQATHCGTSHDEPGINFCIPGPDFRMDQMVSLETLQMDAGSRSDASACEDNVEFHKLGSCTKTPSHKKYSPLQKFSMDNIPPFYQKKEITRVICIVADVIVHVSVKYVSEKRPETVRVSVKYVSEKIPETVPDTDISYPWHSDKDLMRVGSGWVVELKKYRNETCGCKECQNSPTPSTNFAQIYVKTAAHVVCDDLARQHGGFQMLVDVSETPIVYTDLVCDVYNDVTNQTRVIKCWAHNPERVSRLKSMNQEHSHYQLSLTRDEGVTSMSHVQQNGITSRKQDYNLEIAESQPQEYTKQVRISCYGNADTKGTLRPCTLITFRGFSEVRVIVLGKDSLNDSCD